MNNIFKVSSRFAGLTDDMYEKVDISKNKNKNVKKERTRFKEDEVLFKENDFPELTVSVNQQPSVMNYANKVLHNNISVQKKEPLINEGCVIYKRDPITRKTDVIRHPKDVERANREKEIKITKNIIKGTNQLVELYERKTSQFIEINGYDIWEKTFKYPNWQEYEAGSEESDDNDSSDEQCSEDDIIEYEQPYNLDEYDYR